MTWLGGHIGLQEWVSFLKAQSSDHIGRRGQVAKAVDCKSIIPGSNPGGAFYLSLRQLFLRQIRKHCHRRVAVGGNSIDWIGTYWTAAAGSYSIDLAGGDDGTIFATNGIPTVIGQTYLLRFAMAGNLAGGSTTKTMVVSVNDLVSQTYTFSTVGKWRTNMGWVYHCSSST